MSRDEKNKTDGVKKHMNGWFHKLKTIYKIMEVKINEKINKKKKKGLIIGLVRFKSFNISSTRF